jgi:hypothetical protein
VRISTPDFFGHGAKYYHLGEVMVTSRISPISSKFTWNHCDAAKS